MDLATNHDVRRHQGNRCVHCHFWDKRDTGDWSAPEGHCRKRKDPGHYPFGYWPSTLAADGCGKFKQARQYMREALKHK